MQIHSMSSEIDAVNHNQQHIINVVDGLVGNQKKLWENQNAITEKMNKLSMTMTLNNLEYTIGMLCARTRIQAWRI